MAGSLSAAEVSLRLQAVQPVIEQHVFFKPPADQGWLSLPELPQPSEILTAQEDVPQLPENRVDRPWESKADYLQAQYMILRREGIEGLRFSVRRYMATEGLRPMYDDEYSCIYTEVRIYSYILSPRLGPIARVEFSTNRSKLRIKWQHSKRLTPGRLVAITTKKDGFRSICRIATVAQRPYRDGLDQDPPRVDLIWARPEEAIFDPDQELVMIESRNGFYESVRHALVGLQLAAQTDSRLDRYIISLDSESRPPALVQQKPMMDFSTIVHNVHLCKESDELQFQAKALKNLNALEGPPDAGELTTLNTSQLQALHQMVSQELAIVHGGPGTGKTFVSIEAIRVMLASRGHSGNPPLIVAAQTNHALDQLLMMCFEAGAKILRVGSRTKHPTVANYTVFKTRQRSRMPTDSAFKALTEQLRGNEAKIQHLTSGLFGDKLLDPQICLELGVITKAQYHSLCDEELFGGSAFLGPFQPWLGSNCIETEILRSKRPQLEGDELGLYPDDFGFDFDGELDNIADEEEDQDQIHGTEIRLRVKFSGKLCPMERPGGHRVWEHRAAQMLATSQDLYDIDQQYRGAVYQVLQRGLLRALTPRLAALLRENVHLCNKVKVNRWSKDALLVRQQGISIVGCTTTGLTKYRGLLAALSPQTLLVEEAAETREANITSALYPSLQQLCLVGDHKQLSPQCDIQWLGSEPYYLRTSLFQRLVTNRVPHVFLNIQRRMKPELRLLLDDFYPGLADHEYVKKDTNRPNVPGMGGRNCWFFDHSWPEETNSDQSKFNEQEAGMVVRFFAYLVLNGVPSDKITVLTFYNGQRKLLLSKLRRNTSLMDSKSFHVYTVDSYIGNENDVVLLSLVRSPKQERAYSIGFVEDRRRAVVAISRARRGFYVFGNVDNMLNATPQSYRLWATIWNGFARQGRVQRGKGLPLVCQPHGRETWIKEARDWGDNAGGCDQPCGASRPCGQDHRCILRCHPTDHKDLACSQPCRKKLACGHACQNLCSQQCVCMCRTFQDQQSKQVQAIQGRQPQAKEEQLAREPLLEERLFAAGGAGDVLGLPTSTRQRRPQEVVGDQLGDQGTGGVPGTARANKHQQAVDHTDIYIPTSLTPSGRRVRVGERQVRQIGGAEGATEDGSVERSGKEDDAQEELLVDL